MKQRVLLIVRKLNIGGIQRNTVNLANVLHREGHEGQGFNWWLYDIVSDACE